MKSTALLSDLPGVVTCHRLLTTATDYSVSALSETAKLCTAAIGTTGNHATAQLLKNSPGELLCNNVLLKDDWKIEEYGAFLSLRSLLAHRKIC
jgi:hypothetical protein